MLIVENGGNWEKSRRTSSVLPEAHIVGGTIFLPVNIIPAKVSIVEETEESSEIVEVDGYSFDEYRINRAAGLPEEAVAALAAAYGLSMQALSILGVS